MSHRHQHGNPHSSHYGAPPPAHQNDDSSTGKTCLFIAIGIFALCLLLCCGGGIFVYTQADFSFEEDPEATVAFTEEIMDIDIPEEFEPEAVIRMGMIFMDMDMAFYAHRDGQGELLIAEADIIGSDSMDLEQEMQESMQETGVDDEEDHLRITSRDIREFEVRGDTVEFQFAEAEHRQTGQPYRQVSGSFQGRDNPVAAVWVEIEEEYYDEAAIVDMIESIE